VLQVLKLENILDTLKGVIHRGGTREKARRRRTCCAQGVDGQDDLGICLNISTRLHLLCELKRVYKHT